MWGGGGRHSTFATHWYSLSWKNQDFSLIDWKLCAQLLTYLILSANKNLALGGEQKADKLKVLFIELPNVYNVSFITISTSVTPLPHPISRIGTSLTTELFFSNHPTSFFNVC